MSSCVLGIVPYGARTCCGIESACLMFVSLRISFLTSPPFTQGSFPEYFVD